MGKTIVVVSHDPDLIKIADRTIDIATSRLQEEKL